MPGLRCRALRRADRLVAAAVLCATTVTLTSFVALADPPSFGQPAPAQPRQGKHLPDERPAPGQPPSNQPGQGERPPASTQPGDGRPPHGQVLPSQVAPRPASHAAPALDPVEQEAKALFEEAEAKHDQGDVPAALDLMQRSYELSHRPELFFNLAELNGQLGKCRSAIEHYRAYLSRAQAGRYREAAAQSIQRLLADCPDPPQAAGVPEYWTPGRIVGWSAVAAGAAAGVGALAFAWKVARANEEYSDLEHRASAQGGSWDQTRGAEIEADGKRSESWELGLALTSAALTTGGVLFLVLAKPAAGGGTSPQPAAAPNLTWSVDPTGVRGTYSVRF